MVTEAQLRQAFLTQRQSLPLSVKIEMSWRRIRAWYERWDGRVRVNFSGGADSTVTLWLVRIIYPDVPAVFVDTGLEYPEIKEFVRTVDNVTWLKPRMTFKQVCEQYGYPVVSKETAQKIYEARNTKSDFLRQLRTSGVEGRKRQEIPAKWKFLINAPFKISHRCCEILKHGPLDEYTKRTGLMPMTGEMASESMARNQKIATSGCFFMGNKPRLKPLSFWTSADTHALLPLIPHSRLYDMGHDRSGCMMCGFGAHLNCPNKFQIMKRTHPRIHEKALPAFGIDKVLDYMGVPYN